MLDVALSWCILSYMMGGCVRVGRVVEIGESSDCVYDDQVELRVSKDVKRGGSAQG